MARNGKPGRASGIWSRRQFLGTAAGWAAISAPCWAQPSGRPGVTSQADDDFDVIIENGSILDGTGAQPMRSDVAIRGDRIVALGDLKNRKSARRLDATDCVVAPGFIDMHTHSDTALLVDGRAQSAIRQGVTTHVVGNCGGSPAPRREPSSEGERHYQTFAEYLAEYSRPGISLNVCALVGHNTVRSVAMGAADRPPSETELERMQALVEEAMEAGAVGLSTGLVYPPGMFATTEEIIALARVAARHGGMYASHMRGEAGNLENAVAEAIRIGKEAGLPVQISHHKAAGRENWGKTARTLPVIEAANAAGPPVAFDVYPYPAGSAGLDQLVPPWAHDGGREQLLGRLADPETRKRIEHDMTVGTDNWPNFFVIDWNDIQIASVASPANKPCEGRRVDQIAADRGKPGVTTAVDLILEEKGAVSMINFIMDPREVERVMAHPLATFGSDGRAIATAGPLSSGKPHPRSYGCFARVLGRYVREKKLLTLEGAIHKMTQRAARQLGLRDRGRLAPGMAADIAVFDPDRITDRATFEDPHQYAEGVRYVLVNGQLTLEGETHNGTLAGRVLRPQRSG